MSKSFKQLQKLLYNETKKTLTDESALNFSLRADMSLDMVYKYMRSEGRLSTFAQAAAIAKANGLKISYSINKGEK
jgi:hypothetical protein